MTNVSTTLLCDYCRKPQEQHGVDGKCLFAATKGKFTSLVLIDVTVSIPTPIFFGRFTIK